MAITDYDSLVAAVKSYAARSDTVFSARIPDFISFAEDRLYLGGGDDQSMPPDPLYTPPLRPRVLETSDTLTLDSTGSVPLPDDHLGFRRLSRASDKFGLTYMPPERLAIYQQTSGLPIYYTIEDGALKVGPVYAGDLSIVYWQRHPAITSTNKEGPLILGHGLYYLEACLIEAFAWTQEADLAGAHASKLRGMIKGVNNTARSERYSGPLRVRQRNFIP